MVDKYEAVSIAKARQTDAREAYDLLNSFADDGKGSLEIRLEDAFDNARDAVHLYNSSNSLKPIVDAGIAENKGGAYRLLKLGRHLGERVEGKYHGGIATKLDDAVVANLYDNNSMPGVVLSHMEERSGMKTRPYHVAKIIDEYGLADHADVLKSLQDYDVLKKTGVESFGEDGWKDLTHDVETRLANGESPDEVLSGVGGKKGFTIVELLVVISIIAILISLVLPSLGKARFHANDVKMDANLRGVTLGLETYSMENGSYPVNRLDGVIVRNDLAKDMPNVILEGNYIDTFRTIPVESDFLSWLLKDEDHPGISEIDPSDVRYGKSPIYFNFNSKNINGISPISTIAGFNSGANSAINLPFDTEYIIWGVNPNTGTLTKSRNDRIWLKTKENAPRKLVPE